MRDNIRIVRMQERHIPSIARLERACFSTPWREEGLRYELTNPLAVFFAAVDGKDQVAGYAGMHDIVGEGYVTNVAVYPACRRRRIGKRLVEALLCYAGEAHLRLVTLEVRASNAGAIALYESLGFERVGARPRYYEKPREDAFIMTRQLLKSETFPNQLWEGEYLAGNTAVERRETP